MPPSSLLRPLPLDIFSFLWPILVGLGAFYFGRFFHRYSIALRSVLVGLTVGAIVVVSCTFFHVVPRPVEIAFSRVGGVIIILCWMILGVIGISWAAPNPGAGFFVRFLLTAAPLVLIASESGGSLWFRTQAIDTWFNLPGESGRLMQTTKTTCLPASSVMLLHQYGIDNISEGEFAYLANTTFFGTEGHGMARAITSKIADMGGRAELVSTDFDTLLDRGKPFIAQVQFEKIGNHSVLVKKIGPNTLVWIDPNEGYDEHISPQVFKYMWTGRVIWVEGIEPLPQKSEPPPKTTPRTKAAS